MLGMLGMSCTSRAKGAERMTKSPWSVFQSFRALMVMVFQDGTETVAMAIIVGVKVE